MLTAERTEKKQLRHDLSELELKLKAAERGEKRSRLERVSEGVLLEQIELLKNERDEVSLSLFSTLRTAGATTTN